jgi:cytoskeleton protein RodZ
VSEPIAIGAEPNSGPGPRLRRARETRGLTEQQVAEQLNLDAPMVVALERDDLATLGAPVFARGHLRRYGALLGLADDELLAAYERVRTQTAAPTPVPWIRQQPMPIRGAQQRPWVAGGALLFVLAAGLAAYVAEHGLRWGPGVGQSVESTRGAAPVATAAQGPAAATLAEGTAASAPSVSDSFAGTTSAPAQSAAQPVPHGHVGISLTFATDSWAEIYDRAGKAVLYDLGRAGTRRSIAAAAPLRLTIGNAPGVTLVVNGRPAAIPAVPGGGSVARFTIDASGTVR